MIEWWAHFPPPPPISHELQYISVTSGFTKLSMKTKNVCRGLSLYVNNVIKKFTCKNLQLGGGRGKRAEKSLENHQVPCE